MFLFILLMVYCVNVHEMLFILLWWNWAGKCHNKVNTAFVVTFLLPIWKTNVSVSPNIEMADAEVNTNLASVCQGSHFSGLTKFPDFSSIFFHFPLFFKRFVLFKTENFIHFSSALGPAYEFGYNEYPAITSSFLCVKITESNINKNAFQ